MQAGIKARPGALVPWAMIYSVLRYPTIPQGLIKPLSNVSMHSLTHRWVLSPQGSVT